MSSGDAPRRKIGAFFRFEPDTQTKSVFDLGVDVYEAFIGSQNGRDAVRDLFRTQIDEQMKHADVGWRPGCGVPLSEYVAPVQRLSPVSDPIVELNFEIAYPSVMSALNREGLCSEEVGRLFEERHKAKKTVKTRIMTMLGGTGGRPKLDTRKLVDSMREKIGEAWQEQMQTMTIDCERFYFSGWLSIPSKWAFGIEVTLLRFEQIVYSSK